jgi:hypothetical protein
MGNNDEDKNYLDRMTLKPGDLQLVKRGKGAPLRKVRVPGDWIDETSAKSGETLTIHWVVATEATEGIGVRGSLDGLPCGLDR